MLVDTFGAPWSQPSKVAEVAVESGETDAVVNAILDQEAKRLFDADKMLKDIMFEGARLAAICKKI